MLNIFNAFSLYVFGIGNPYASDDRIGLFIINELLKTNKLNSCFIKPISTDLFELTDYLVKIPANRPILIVDAILTDFLPLSSVIVFNLNQKPVSEIKFATTSHTLNVLEIITMNQISTKKNYEISFMGLVFYDIGYGEEINMKILDKKNFIISLIDEFCHDENIQRVYS